MSEPIVTRADIAERARAAAKRYLETGEWPMNEFPALSDAAQFFDVCLRRCINGGDADLGEEASA